MKRNFNSNLFISELEENELETPGAESPPSTTFNDMKITPSPKRSRRSIQRRVVSVPIKDVDGSRMKGDTAPPSDSWAWRKYGQKPIKGSPYPRGYYRCSSSKGCPARKQVERSRDDPTMILITYTCEHNHQWPASRNSHKNQPNKPEAEPELTVPEPEPEPSIAAPETEPEPEHEPEEKFADLGGDAFAWFGDMETTSSMIFQSPIFSERRVVGDTTPADVAMIYPMREEDESLFADLGELPECSVVFRHRNVGPQVEIC